jgi:peptidoglycan DL-endopeptidase CwlO
VPRRARLHPIVRRLRPRRVALAAALAALTAMAPAGALAAPPAIEAKRAEIARVEAELAGIDSQVAAAAEAFNGARYRLTEVQTRIEENRRAVNSSARALAGARVVLAGRLRQLYANPQPTMGELLVGSGSLAEAMERVRVLEQVSEQDGAVIDSIGAYRTRLAEARTQLGADQRQTRRELAAARAEREKVVGLLRARQAVLAEAEAELGGLLEAERRRERAEAERQRRIAAARQEVVAQGAAPTAPAGAAPSAPAPAIPSGSGNAAAAQLALSYLGVPYVWGGASPSGFDCSGLPSYVYAQIGKSVPHYTVAIYNGFPKVPREALQPGDLVFFNGLGHMGIYIGGGQMVHSPSTGDVVKVTPLSERSDFVGAVRP